MAKQRGFLRLEGTMGDVTFVKTKDGFRARNKSSVSGSRFANDPAYARLREHNADFIKAAKGGKLLRTAFPALLSAAADGRVTGRVTAAMLKIVQSDPVNVRGQKQISDGNLALLEGWEFNINASLTGVFKEPFVVTANPGTGVADINISGFVPRVSLSAPSLATHYQLVMGAASIDFDSGIMESAFDSTGYKFLDNANTGSLGMNCTLIHTPAATMVVVFGIQFSVLDNGNYYPLKNSSFNALQIVKVVA